MKKRIILLTWLTIMVLTAFFMSGSNLINNRLDSNSNECISIALGGQLSNGNALGDKNSKNQGDTKLSLNFSTLEDADIDLEVEEPEKVLENPESFETISTTENQSQLGETTQLDGSIGIMGIPKGNLVIIKPTSNNMARVAPGEGFIPEISITLDKTYDTDVTINVKYSIKNTNDQLELGNENLIIPKGNQSYTFTPIIHTPNRVYKTSAYDFDIYAVQLGESGQQNRNASSSSSVIFLQTPGITSWPTATDIIYGQTLSQSSLAGGKASISGTFSFSNANIIPDAAGVYKATVTFTPSDINYTTISGIINVNVLKADPTIVVTGYNGFYDGEAHGATGSVTGVNGEPLTGLNLGNSFTNVPGGTANWSFTGNDNYNADSGSVAITINKADAAIEIKGYTGMYDGEAHGATGTAIGVKDEDLSSLLNLGDTFTDVPGGTANWSFSGDTNYNEDSGSVEIVINKADATVEVNGYSGTYDGEAHGATGTAKGVKDEDLSSLLNLGDTFTNVPGGTVNWSFAGNTNYNQDSGSVEIVIDKADAVIEVKGYTGMYDGEAHGATGTAIGVKDEDLSSLLDLGDTFTDVPGGTANWSFTGNDNYNADSDSVAITINKADAAIDVQGYTGIYDGEAHGATGTAKGIKNEDLSNLLNLGDTFTDVPGGTAEWSFAGNNNYNADSGSVVITISKADATIEVKGYTGIYDGETHGATGTAKGVKEEDLSSLLNLGKAFTDVPGGTAEWSFAGNNNYNADSGSVVIAISKADATISVEGYTGTYDGNPHGASGTAIGVKGETLAGLNLGESFTNVPGGTATWVFTDVIGNYNNATGTVEIKILYNFNGFFKPVENGNIKNKAKAGSSVPLKFSLNGYFGLDVIKSLRLVDYSSLSALVENELPLDESTAGKSGLQYDQKTDTYTYVWKTEKALSGDRKLVVELKDGTKHELLFNFK